MGFNAPQSDRPCGPLPQVQAGSLKADPILGLTYRGETAFIPWGTVSP